MALNRFNTLAFYAALVAVLLLAGCAKKAAKVTPPPPPAATPAPAATVAAKPTQTQPAAAAAPAPSPTDEELFARNVKDVFFDYDKSSIRPNEAPVVQNDEVFFRNHPHIKVLVEGHCDDRGSEEYNIALGANRAESVKEALAQGGVPADQVKTVSYGKEKPFCTDQNEQCWQQNRVDHFAFAH